MCHNSLPHLRCTDRSKDHVEYGIETTTRTGKKAQQLTRCTCWWETHNKQPRRKASGWCKSEGESCEDLDQRHSHRSPARPFWLLVGLFTGCPRLHLIAAPKPRVWTGKLFGAEGKCGRRSPQSQISLMRAVRLVPSGASPTHSGWRALCLFHPPS